MSYIDWRHLPKPKQVPAPRQASTLQILIACGAGLLPFALLGILAAFARNAEAPVTTGLLILGP